MFWHVISVILLILVEIKEQSWIGVFKFNYDVSKFNYDV